MFVAGMSAVGLAAAALGAAHVVVTDLASQMDRMTNNIEVNGMVGQVVAAPLDWRSDPFEYDNNIQCGSYDVILASDVIYTPTLVPDLVKTMKALLGEHTVLLLGWERREGVEDVTAWLLLNDGCLEGGLQLDMIDSANRPPGWRSPDIWMYEIRRLKPC